MYNHEMEININYEKIKVKCTNDVVAWRNTLLLLYHYSGRRESLWRLARLSWPTPPVSLVILGRFGGHP